MNIVKIVIVAAIIGGAYQYLIDSRSVDINSVGGITVEENNYRIDYIPEKNQKGDVYMVFGGGRSRTNGDIFGQVWLSLLPINDAEHIKGQYPDFTMCKSKGAAFVKNKLIDFNIFPSNGELEKKVENVGIENSERNRNNGHRLCVSLSGKTLTPHFESTNPDVNFNVDAMKRENIKYMLLNNLEVFDCLEVI